MKNTKKLFALCFGLVALPCLAQENTVAAGGDIVSTNGSMSFSVGQVFYTHHNSPDASKNAGVQQPIEFFTVSIGKNAISDVEMHVFPNPSIRNVTLQIKDFDGKERQLRFFSLTGSELFRQKIQSSETTLELENYATGSYLLRVEDENKQEIKTFRIVKH
jgi:hypothetical protein